MAVASIVGLAGCVREPQTPGAEASSGGVPVAEAPPESPSTPGSASTEAPATVIEVRFNDHSFPVLHPELEAMLREALTAEAQRCPGLAFDVRVGYGSYAEEHWVYEADSYLLVFVGPERFASGRAGSEDGFFFMLMPGESRPMSGATLVLDGAARVGSGRAAAERLVQVAVRHAARGLARLHGVACL